MLRAVLGTIMGAVVCVATIMLVQVVSMMFFPPPPGIDLTDPQAVEKIPLGAIVGVLVSYVLGSFVGGWLAGLIGRYVLSALGVGVLVFLASIYNLYQIPHPTWFAAVNLLAVIPAAWLGYLLSARRSGDAAKTTTPD